ncbi:MAG: hypothetical protein E6Z13_03110, partial [Dermabacter sp.]|nr:hypothetical protein [Dermabacter sp.]
MPLKRTQLNSTSKQGNLGMNSVIGVGSRKLAYAKIDHGLGFALMKSAVEGALCEPIGNTADCGERAVIAQRTIEAQRENTIQLWCLPDFRQQERNLQRFWCRDERFANGVGESVGEGGSRNITAGI